MGNSSKVERRRNTPIDRHIFLCTGAACGDGNGELWRQLKGRCSEPELDAVERTQARCLRICERGGVALVYPEGAWYWDLDADALDRVVDEHLIRGRVAEDLLAHRNPLISGAGEPEFDADP